MSQKNEEKIQHIISQLQLIESQLKETEHQISEVEAQKQELTSMDISLLDLKKNKKNSPSFSPMGLGIYAKSKIEDTNNMLVNIGSNIFMEKPIEEVSDNIKKQVKKFEELFKTLNQNYYILSIQNQTLQEQLQESFGGN